MISNKEMFCAVAGVIITTVPKEFTTDLLFQSAEEFGITKDEAKVILTELKDTLGFACAKMLKKMQGENSTTFGV
jgi:hypothetical protein|tara:strand:- start:281 stop:505 length:225 start_codon:yes stop_codon:yes gene_type:complete